MIALALAVLVVAWQPNAKQLKPIGLVLSVLAVGSALALVI
jgi:hypothetical protein